MRLSTRKVQFICFVLFIAVYAAITLFTTPNPLVLHVYHLSFFRYHVIIDTVVLLLIAIWLTAFFGFAKLRTYADIIKKNKEGRQVSRLAVGVMILVFQLPFTSMVGAILSRIAQAHHGFMPTDIILSHYLSLVLPLISFVFISIGARGLTESVKARPSQAVIYVLAAVFIMIGSGFTFFVFEGVPVHGLFQQTNRAIYDLPNWLLFFTIVVPYIFTWFIGLLAAYEVYLYKQKAPGILYRRAWSLLALGFGWVILMSIVFQYITALSGHITALHINALLLVIYSALVLLAVGYVLIAAGTKKLQKIEEV